MKITVLVIKENSISSVLLVQQLKQSGYESWPCLANQSSITHALQTLSPTFAIADLDTNRPNSIETIRIIRQKSPHTKCIAFVNGDRSDCLPVLLEDVSGCLTHQATFDELNVCLIQLHEGRKYVSEEIKQILQMLNTNVETQHPVWNELTKREKEIVIFIARGYSNQKIADLLFRSPKTVAATKYNLVKKLNLNTLRDLTVLASTICNLNKPQQSGSHSF